VITPERHLGVVAARIQRSGGQTVVVGLFTESVMLSTMNYCAIATAVPELNAAAPHDFTGRATQHGGAPQFATDEGIQQLHWQIAQQVPPIRQPYGY
jgi:hypothetical protein